MENIVYNMDCMDFMRDAKDGEFDLAIVDPPFFGMAMTFHLFNSGWDPYPTPTMSEQRRYLDELFRVSRNQVIFHADQFFLPPDGFRIRIADEGFPIDMRMKVAERVYCSVPIEPCVLPKMRDADGKIHPNQRSVGLYEAILSQVAKPGDRILDTHVGSGSIRIACHKMGFDFAGCEIHPGYYESQESRYRQFLRDITAAPSWPDVEIPSVPYL